MIKATTSHEAYLEYIHHRYKGNKEPLEIEGLDHQQSKKFIESLDKAKQPPLYTKTTNSIIIYP